MFSANNIELRLGGKLIFDGVSLLINKGDKIGLTGRNGAGKSTLLKVFSGKMEPEKGNVSFPKGYKIAMLSQDMVPPSENNVINEAKTAFAEIEKLKLNIDTLTKQLELRDDYESDDYMQIIEDLGDSQNRLNLLGSDNVEEKIEEVLFGLGFVRRDFDKKMSELSGGWQMRVELAKILLQNPDLVLLDEPTNHLDIESILWLENFLTEYYGSVVMVSHDKTFLDAVTNRTVEIFNSKIEDYKTNYTHYLTLRQERREQVENAYKNQQDQIKQIERNIERFRAKDSKAKFAQSLIKQLDRMERIELEDEDNKALNIRFQEPAHSGKIICELEDVKKNYDDQEVIKGFTFKVEKGDKVAFVGKNGMGKSTLAKIIANDIEDYEGDVKIGHNVLMGYYAQNQSVELKSNMTVFETIDDEATGDMRVKVRNMLGAFLFSGDDVDKRIKVLSGGERGRLAMCKLLLKPYNFLVLDEPTNHLDIKAKERLKEALMNYQGTFIVVSHDREFLAGLTDKTYEFTENGIKEHLGNVEDFLAKKKVESFRQIELNPKQKTTNKQVKSDNSTKIDEREVKKLEAKIEKLENKKVEMESEMASQDFIQNDDNSTFYEQYNSLKLQLDKYMAKWEEAIG